uniref:Cytochrome P450 n=1 Tax=Oryza punctata TaxID=4537 RepID=A0A0E0M9Z7_ORYPU
MDGDSSHSPALTVAGAVALVAFCSYYLAVTRAGSKARRQRRRHPPVVGTVFHQLYHVRRLHDYYTALCREQTTFRLLATPGRRKIYTCDPAVVEHILRTNFPNYGKGPLNSEILRDLFGEGIFAVDGEKWRTQRKIASYDFTTRALRDFSNDVFKRNAAKLAGVVSSHAASNQCMNFKGLLTRATMDSIFTIAFGTDLNTMDGSGEGHRFAKAFDDAGEYLLLRYLNPFWKVARLLNVGAEATLKKRIKVVDEFVYKLIRARSDELSNTKAQDHRSRDDLLSRFIQATTNDSGTVDYKYLRDIVLNIVIAAKDSTSGSLAWFLYMTCKRPEVQEKIFDEVMEATNAGDTASINEFLQSLTDQALNKMHYLHAALTETLRLYPSVPLENKQCFSDDVLPNGFSISKGDAVFYMPYAMGRMEFLWGKDAEAFRPERWLDENGIFQPESPFKFTAFQAGPRICIGKDFAYRQMKIFAAVLIRFFVFKLRNDKDSVTYRTAITLAIDQAMGDEGGGDSSYSAAAVMAAASLALVVAICSYLAVARRDGGKQRRRRRRPPVAGTVFHQLYQVRRVHDYHTALSREHMTFRLLVPASRGQIYTCDPAVVEHILRTNFANYGKGEFNYENMSDLFGDGIFTVDGDKWKQQRKIASYDFSTRALRDFSGAVFKRNAAKLAGVVSSYAASNQSMDFQGLLMRATMDSIFTIAFGQDLNTLDGSGEGRRFAAAFDDASEFTMLRYLNPFWKLARLLNIGAEAMLKERIKIVDGFVYKLIRDRSDELSNTKEHDHATTNDSGTVDYKYLRDIILNIVIAGKDTTAGSLAWFLYMVCKHPEVQEKICREAMEATNAGEAASIDEFSQSLTDEALNKMHYLHAALTETLRLYPAVPLDNKQCFSDDVLPNGFNVSKGDIVFYIPYAMGRMESLWGKDAEAFQPERWLDENGVFQQESPFKFTAFQAGPRICLGKDFAYRQMKIFVAVLLRFFVFKLRDEKEIISYRTMITLSVNQAMGAEGGWDSSSYSTAAVMSASGLALVAMIFSYLAVTASNKQKRRRPPVVGTVFHQLYHVRRIHDYHTALSREHTTFRMLVPAGGRQIYTSDPAVVEHILKTNFANYGKGPVNHGNMRDLIGDGIFAVDGGNRGRSPATTFSRRVLRDFSSAVFKKNAAKLAGIVSTYAASNQSMDFQGLMLRATMDSIFTIAFGTDLNMLDGSGEGSRFATAFDDANEFTMLRYISPFWKLAKLLNVCAEAMLKESVNVVDEFGSRQDILSRFLQATTKDSGTVDYKYLRDIILNIVIAGKDTTAGALAWFLYMVCKHPELQEKICREAIEATNTGEATSVDEFLQSLTDQALNNMQYLHAALTETLRLHPSVPMENKQCFSDDVLPNGYNVGKGDIVFFIPYAMGRMENLWGKDAEAFRPERWLDENNIFQQESPFKFTAFQAGPRICLGKEFAYRQMKIFPAVLLRFFVLKLHDETEIVSYRTTLTLSIDQAPYNLALNLGTSAPGQQALNAMPSWMGRRVGRMSWRTSATRLGAEMTNSSAGLFGVEVGNLASFPMEMCSVGHFSANTFGAEFANLSTVRFDAEPWLRY